MPEEDMSGRVCVLGVGNTLLGDEGFGVRAMEYLRDNYVWPGNVDFVDGGTQGMGLMPLLVDYDKVAVLDIVHGVQKHSPTFSNLQSPLPEPCPFSSPNLRHAAPCA